MSTSNCPKQDWGKPDYTSGARAKPANSTAAGIPTSCLAGAGAILTALRAGQGIKPDAKKPPTNIFQSSRVREQLGGGLAASQGQPSAVAEGVSLVALVQSQPVAVSWGADKIPWK